MADESQYRQFSADHLSSSTHAFDQRHQDLYGIQSGIEMLGFPSKHHIMSGVGGFINRESNRPFQSVIPSVNSWPIDDSSIRSSRDHAVQFRSADTAYTQQNFQLRDSKYLCPAQHLLNEFCSLGTDHPSDHKKSSKKKIEGEPLQNHQSIQSMNVLELHELKAKLLSMIEEINKRYRNYCIQMKTLVSSFESVAGEKTARVYSLLASKAMSRHFRCLKDCIVGQLKAVKSAITEKELSYCTNTTTTTTINNVTTTRRVDTPRLKLIDQCIRQQKFFQQGMMTEHQQMPWRPQRGLPERAVSVLRSWLFDHFLHPYPNDVDKHILARQTGLSRSQVSNWFINARVRLWKPMVEEMYMEEMKELNIEPNSNDTIGQASNTINSNSNPNPNPNPNSSSTIFFDQKPSQIQLVNHHDSESLSSIINSSGNHHHKGSLITSKTYQQQENIYVSDHQLDFDYRNHTTNDYQHLKNSGNVSLTLGLQQHYGNGGIRNFCFTSNSDDHDQQSHGMFTRDEDIDHIGQHGIHFSSLY